MLLTSLSNVGVVDLEVCCPIFGTLHSAPRYLNIINRSEFSVGPVPHSMMLKMLEIFQELIRAVATRPCTSVFWNGYHLLIQLHTGEENCLLSDTAGDHSGIDISLYIFGW